MNNNQNIITSALIVGAVTILLLGGMGMGSHMYGTGMMFGWGGMGLGMGFFWALILIGLFVLFSDRTPYRSSNDRAKEIARERYARGEISENEFEEIMKKL
jgi:putative membrane protein